MTAGDGGAGNEATDEAARRFGLGSLAANVGSLLTSNVVNRATSFVVYALVARLLGARELGQIALAVSLFQLGSRFVLLGLDTLTTREVAKDHHQTGRLLATSSAAVTVSALVALPVMWAFVEVMDYSRDTSRVILILFAGMVPYALSQMTEATFLGWERSKYVAASNSPIWIIQATTVFVLLQAGYGVEMVAISMVAAYVAMVAVHWVLLLRTITRSPLVVDFRFVPAMLRSAAPFLGIQALNAVRANIGIVFLSRFAGEAAVGIYSAAKQMLVPLNLVFQATGLGVFPAMVRRFASGVSGLRRLSRRLIEFTLALAVPAVTGLFVLAGPLLILVFRDPEFGESVVVLRILVWTTIQFALTAILGQILWASRQERISFRISLANTIVMVVVAFVLIWRFDVVGAAIASVVVGALNVVQHYLPVARLFTRLDIVRLAWKPVAASGVMAAVLLATGAIPLGLRIVAGGLGYVGALFLLYLLEAGGYDGLRGHLRSAGLET